MSEFVFKMFDRVIVPDNDGAQGVITSVSKSNNRDPQYGVIFLKIVDAEGQTLALPINGTVRESDLVAAQPPKMITVAEAEKLADEARLAVTAELGNDIAKMAQQIERLRISARRRQKAKKPTRNRRRR